MNLDFPTVLIAKPLVPSSSTMTFFPTSATASRGLGNITTCPGANPSEQEPGLRVFVPSAEYILAMKLMSMRIGAEDPKDRNDIINLMTIIGLRSPGETIAFVAGFFPEAKVSQKVLFGIDELFRSSTIALEVLDDVAPAYLGRGGPARGGG